MVLFLTTSNHHFPHFVSIFISSYWAEIETSNLVGGLIVASDSHRRQIITEGAWSGHVNHYILMGTSYMQLE